jgi:hypothetical protein
MISMELSEVFIVWSRNWCKITAVCLGPIQAEDTSRIELKDYRITNRCCIRKNFAGPWTIKAPLGLIIAILLLLLPPSGLQETVVSIKKHNFSGGAEVCRSSCGTSALHKENEASLN